MTTFTDKDITKWKDEIAKYDGQGIFRIYGHEMLALLDRLEAAEGMENQLVCKHGHLKRSCYTCELEVDCIRLQQEINCLRMEPCQLPKCVQEQARGSRLQKALKDCAKEPPPCLMCKQALVEEEARKG